MDIVHLIDELEDVVSDGGSIPFSKKVSVDPDEVMQILNDMRNALPEELKQARWINEEKERILDEAKKQAEKMEEDAKSKLQRSEEEAKKRFEDLVNEHAITKAATKKGEDTVAKAQANARQIREGSFAYVDKILKATQDNLKDVIQALEQNRSELK